MKLVSSSPALSLSVLFTATLVACGGGSDTASAPPPPAATTVKITGKAVDGPLQGAIACYDLNDNGACDSGEPTSAPSDADGNFSFDVDTAVAGRHRVVVDVPATAIDKDTGAAVGTGFTLQSPATSSATQAVFVSPLTTLVQAQIDTTGATLSAATEFIQTQAGLSVSPLADFTAGTSTANRQAANVARLVVLTTQQQNTAVASVVGTADISGSTITARDLNKVVAQAVIAALPTVAATVADPTVANATGAALQTALTAAAQTVVAQTGLTVSTAAASVGVNKLPPDLSAASSPRASATLTALRYTSANNWYYRTLESSAADNTPDANGNLRYYDVHKESTVSNYAGNAGVVNAWALGTARARSGDLHWTGSTWAACSFGQRYTSTVRDAQGRSSYDFCDGYELGSSTRSAVDIAGRSIASVFSDTIRQFPGSANGVAYANWGPADLSVFGSATFPTGSKLFYQNNTVTKAAFAYDVQASNALLAFASAVAAGGDARTGSPTCGQVTPANSASFQTPVSTLEDLVARNPGTPCLFNPGTNADGSSGADNQWWSNATVSLGSVVNLVQALPLGTNNYYSTTGLLRVAFAANNVASFYQCLQRRLDGSTRNCTAIGSGTYAIQTLGDARVMTFTGLPAVAQKLGYTRVFIERGGKVWFGYQSPVGVTNALLRLNLEATNAVFAPLGMPAVKPVTQASDFSAAATAALATARGVFGAASDTGAIVFRFGDNGRFLVGQADPANTLTREQSGAELGYFDTDPATGRFSTLIEVDSNLTVGLSHPELNPTLSFTATQINLVNSDGTPESFPRLVGGTTGILGLWALGSATDLKVQHFAFFPNGRVLMADSLGVTVQGSQCQINRQGPPGAEFASYTFDAIAGTLRVFNKLYDTNGCAGFFDSAAATPNTEANFTVVFSTDNTTATVTNAANTAEVYTFYRIAAQ
jgi:hypothetical protein